MAYLVTGTFVAVNNWDKPTASPMLHVLKVELPALAEAPYQNYVPRLTGYDSPPLETVPTLAKAILVPCSIIVAATVSRSMGYSRFRPGSTVSAAMSRMNIRTEGQ